MKRLSLLIASLAAVLSLQAQTIPSGSEWFTGGMQYEATRHADGSVTMYMMNEGEETEYTLTPVSGKPGQYTGKNFADETVTYKLIQRAGQTILAQYDPQGHLEEVMELTDRQFEENLLTRFFHRICGIYSFSDPESGSTPLVIGQHTVTVNGVTSRSKALTFNGYPMDILEIEDGPWKGMWHFVMSASGLNAYRTRIDEYGMSEDIDEKPVTLVWNDPDRGRWDFLSQDFVSRLPYTKQTLRIMRNAILAKHGYVFKSEDLKLKFEFEPWYNAIADNAAIQLSLIEEMNIAMIQVEEAKSNDARYVTEEEPGFKRYQDYDE